MSLNGALESLLFVAGEEGLSIGDLELLLGETREQLEQALDALSSALLLNEERGLALVQFANRYQLVTKGAYADIIKQYAVSPFATKLSQAALETLAIIAYKQPITRAQVDYIRGVQSIGAIQKLQLRDLIESKGRENSPGKPILYGTTDYFMNYFAIEDFSQLPDIASFETLLEEDAVDLFSQRYAHELDENGEK